MDSLDGECPYAILGVPETASNSEIKKAYRKKALKAHPDKNPDVPDAAQIFHRIVMAHDILADADAKAAYDRVLQLKQAAKMRDLKLTAEQRKAKEDLERRESEFKKRRTDAGDAKRRLEAEIIRLREHGEARLAQERDRLLREAAEEAAEAGRAAEHEGGRTDLKVKWKTKSVAGDNGGYSRSALQRLFCKYGPVSVVMGKKDGRAVVTFVAGEDAEAALQFERGLSANPLQECKWVGGDSDPPVGQGSIPFQIQGADLADVEEEAFANLRRAAKVAPSK